MKGFFRAISATLRDRLRLIIARRVVWLTIERRDQLGECSALAALVGVIGREYYDERIKTYPIRSYFELDRVLALEANVDRRTLTIIGPVTDDQREVLFFDLNERFDPKLFNAFFWIPETFLASRVLGADSLAQVQRYGLTYFISGKGLSMVQGGIVRTPELFALSVGLPTEHTSLFWSAEDLRRAFMVGVQKTPLLTWVRLASPDLSNAVRRNWRPASIISVCALIFYLAVSSMYLFLATQFRERELERLGDDVGMLLEKQRIVESLNESQSALLGVLDEQRPTYLLWGLAADTIAAGGAVSGLTLQNGEMTVRGRAKIATNVLTKLAARKDVRNARFSSPVRSNGEDEEFSISLKIDSSHNDLPSKALVKNGR